MLYKLFEENICNAHSYIDEPIPALTLFLNNYVKSKNIDLEFCEKIEENLIHLEMFNNNFDEFFEYFDKINLQNLKLPISEKINSSNILYLIKK